MRRAFIKQKKNANSCKISKMSCFSKKSLIEMEDYLSLSKKCLYFCKGSMIMHSEFETECVSMCAKWSALSRWPLNSQPSLSAEGDDWGVRSTSTETHSPQTSTPTSSLHGLIPHSGTIKVCSCWSYSVSSTPPGKTSNFCGSHWDLGYRSGSPEKNFLCCQSVFSAPSMLWQSCRSKNKAER